MEWALITAIIDLEWKHNRVSSFYFSDEPVKWTEVICFYIEAVFQIPLSDKIHTKVEPLISWQSRDSISTVAPPCSFRLLNRIECHNAVEIESPDCQSMRGFCCTKTPAIDRLGTMSYFGTVYPAIVWMNDRRWSECLWLISKMRDTPRIVWHLFLNLLFNDSWALKLYETIVCYNKNLWSILLPG